MASTGEQHAPEHGEPVLMWTLDGRRFAIPLAAAVEVTAVAALTGGLRGRPQLGHLDLRGASVPAFDARRLLGVEERQAMLSDRFLIARLRESTIALLVDSVLGIGAARSEAAGSADVATQPGLRLARVDGDDDLPLVHVVDLDALISAAA